MCRFVFRRLKTPQSTPWVLFYCQSCEIQPTPMGGGDQNPADCRQWRPLWVGYHRCSALLGQCEVGGLEYAHPVRSNQLILPACCARAANSSERQRETATRIRRIASSDDRFSPASMVVVPSKGNVRSANSNMPIPSEAINSFCLVSVRELQNQGGGRWGEMVEMQPSAPTCGLATHRSARMRQFKPKHGHANGHPQPGRAGLGRAGRIRLDPRPLSGPFFDRKAPSAAAAPNLRVQWAIRKLVGCYPFAPGQPWRPESYMPAPMTRQGRSSPPRPPFGMQRKMDEGRPLRLPTPSGAFPRWHTPHVRLWAPRAHRERPQLGE